MKKYIDAAEQILALGKRFVGIRSLETIKINCCVMCNPFHFTQASIYLLWLGLAMLCCKNRYEFGRANPCIKDVVSLLHCWKLMRLPIIYYRYHIKVLFTFSSFPIACCRSSALLNWAPWASEQGCTIWEKCHAEQILASGMCWWKLMWIYSSYAGIVPDKYDTWTLGHLEV